MFRLARKRPRAWATTYDLPGRRGPRASRLTLMVLAAVLAAGLTFGGLVLMTRSAAAPVNHTPEPSVSGAPQSSPPPPTGGPASTPASPGPTSAQPSSTPANDAVVIVQTAAKFVDAWLQRDRAKRRSGLTATATPELVKALMLTDDANIPRTRRQGGPSIDTQLSDTVLVLQRLVDKTELKVTLTSASGTWLVTAIDMDAD